MIYKPMARSYETAQKIIEAAEGKIKLAVNQDSRWGPAHYADRKLIKAGKIGQAKVMMIESVMSC